MVNNSASASSSPITVDRNSTDKYDLPNEGHGSSNWWSHSSEEPDVLSQPHPHNYSDKSNHRVYRLMVSSLVLSLVVCMFSFLGTFSCTNDSFTRCYPQVTLRFRDTPQARLYLGSAREGLRMASYFAKDFSVMLNDGHKLSERIRQIDHIDTFSDKNLYKFNYNGFCRKSVSTGVETCTYSHGLDLFSSMAKDIGLQLGLVSNAEDPTEIGDSLATAYASSLDTLGQYFGAGKKKPDPATVKSSSSSATSDKEKQKQKQDESTFIDKAKQMKFFGRSISTITSVQMCVSAALVIVQGNIILYLISNKLLNSQFSLRKILTVPMVLTGVLIFLSMLQFTGEVRYFYKLGRFFNNVDVATVTRASGFYFMLMTTTLNIALQSTLVLVFYRK